MLGLLHQEIERNGKRRYIRIVAVVDEGAIVDALHQFKSHGDMIEPEHAFANDLLGTCKCSISIPQ